MKLISPFIEDYSMGEM